MLVSPLSFNQILRMIFSLEYVTPVCGDDKQLSTHKFIKLSLMNVIVHSFDNYKGPTVLFFEGCQTNGLGILKIDEEILKNLILVQQKYRR